MGANVRRRFVVSAPGLAVLTFLLAVSVADAIEIRNPDTLPRYTSDLARAYAPCLAPNDQTADGTAACSPAITSACTFRRGSIEFRSKGTIRVDASITDIAGPGTCTTGTYTLELGLRITADDDTCSGGECTSVDQTLAIAFLNDPPNDLDLQADSIESLLSGGLTGSNVNVQHATVIAPDGLPMAAAGIDGDTATSHLASVGTGYQACATPTTAGLLGPACVPSWPTACDHEAGSMRWRGGGVRGTFLDVEVDDLVGASPSCANGIHSATSLIRVTTQCVASTLCTVPDHAVVLPVTAKNGDINAGKIPLSTIPAFASSPAASLQVLGNAVFDPDMSLLAAPALNALLRLTKMKVKFQRDLTEPDADSMRIEAIFPSGAIDPNAPPGTTFTVASRTGTVYTVTIPAGLWQLSAPVGTRWDFEDESGGLNGVRKISIKQAKLDGEPNGYKIKLQAKDTTVTPGSLGVTLSIAIPIEGGFDTATARHNRTCKSNGRTYHCK